MDRLSQRDVMKLRPHPGTTILFCAIKENPRRKNCRVLLGRVRPVEEGFTSVLRTEAIRRGAGRVASRQQKIGPAIRAICERGVRTLCRFVRGRKGLYSLTSPST
ncbi:hypothetical protein Bphyt_0457 [Paraburkholderia phytofirmans PsJN]|uniref:Uncharacterized protein n=1 Tax=Paraburkholderia phytofirmans (strain DSM 17436 / LMG 22146 / PsJN) TaxID=398527 RepID=B2SWT8_PARPJ|nr:hypothetical protein Bphyt_0457 [Paraburkholderia phytofirmans PsJN]